MGSFAGWFRGAGQLGAIAATQHHLIMGQAKIMSALDDLKTAVDGAVAEMQHAVETIQNHSNPDVANDPALADMATRLNNAVAALKGVEPASDAAANPPADSNAQPPAGG